MTDPFFKTKTSVQQSPEHTHILAQQKEIEENFEKLKKLYSEPWLSEEQKNQIKNKLLELKKIYTNNKTTLEQAGIAQENKNNQNQDTAHVHVNKIDAVEDTTHKKTVTTNGILLWCGVLFILLLGGVAFLFYYMISHPSSLKNIGLAPENVKKLLQTFTTVFFWSITIIGFIFFVMNIYRIFTSKKRSKLSYFFGILLGIFLLSWWILLGYRVMEKVNTISIDSILNNSNLVRPYLITKDRQEYLGDKNIPILWPVQIKFWFNTTVFVKQVLPKIQGNPTEIKLRCGNGQTLVKSMNTDLFEGVCFYRDSTKKDYSLEVIVWYRDAKTKEQRYHTINVGMITLQGGVALRTLWGEALNRGNEPEILWGKAGDTITFDASDIFRSLGIDSYEISWDLDGDWIVDRQDETKVNYRYTVAGVYTATFRIPSIGDHLYSFPIRIEQSEVPVGNLETQELGNNTYIFSTKFFETNTMVVKYLFQVLDSNKKPIHRKEQQNGDFTYRFEQPGSYHVKVIFATQDGKQGSMISSPVIIQDTKVDIRPRFQVKTYAEEQFHSITPPLDNTTYNVTLSEIPSTVQLHIDKEYLRARGYHITVKEWETPIVFVDNMISIDVVSPEKRRIWITVMDTDNKVIAQKNVLLTVEKEALEENLLITPDTVGTSPFTVKFDASTSTINDPEDEIVYFTWDFGDGEIKKNISESIVQHTYHYDIKKNNGEYYPKIHIKTKKWKQFVIGEGTIILVKQAIKTLNIHVDSHPGQVAKRGDIVKLSVQLDGLPTKIVWDFGDDEEGYICKWRECVEVSKIYHGTGKYNVKVKVEYENRIPLEGDISLLIK